MEMPKKSGKFVLRLDPEIHAQLIEIKEEKNISLNELCKGYITSSLYSSTRNATHSTIWTRLAWYCMRYFPDFNGIVLFGSVARGEATENSDCDVAVILNRGANINRKLYKQWEVLEEAWEKEYGIPLKFQNWELQPSIISLPELGTSTTSLWAELSIDGIVLSENKFSISRYLSFARREISSGKLIRKTSYGHGYWVYKEVNSK